MNENSILIVEDDGDWRTLLSESIADLCVIRFAENYSAAIELLRAYSFDAVILDLRLEDQDEENFQGMKILAVLRESETEKDWRTSVIIVSAYGTPQQVRESFKIHYLFDYISKQRFDKNAYRDVVRQAMASRSRQG